MVATSKKADALDRIATAFERIVVLIEETIAKDEADEAARTLSLSASGSAGAVGSHVIPKEAAA